MDNIEVKIASTEDQIPIAEILEEGREWLKDKGIPQWINPFSSEWIKKRLNENEFYKAQANNETIAIFRLLHNDPFIWGEQSEKAIYIHSLAVRRKYHGKGIGRYLLEWVEEFANNNKYKYLRLDCMAENAALCNYYAQAGFLACEVKEIQLDNNLWKSQLFQKSL
jgi:ribosomal protein S18 acetylase RimI-like enzyme